MNNKELSNTIKRVNNWYSKKSKVLSIKTRPYNTFKIFIGVISKVLNNNGKILYVWCCKNREHIKRKQYQFNKSVLEPLEKDNIINNIKFISISDIYRENEEYDLVIFDDISIFSKESIENIRDSIEDVYWKVKKIIIYSYETIFPIGEKLDLVYLVEQKPMIEPRVLNTRIRLEEDIPLALFEYFKWFKENGRKVLIIVPSEDKLNKVYNQYYNSLKDIRVIKYVKGENIKFVLDIVNGTKDCVFVITNSIDQYISYVKDISVVMLFADDIYYNYKKIVYACGAINNTNEILSEVLLVSREVNENLDEARSIIRDFNRSLWEKKLLR